jgi:ATP-dependent helicase HrpB
LSQAEEKLTKLKVIEPSSRITDFGRQVHSLGGNANIAIMLLKSAELSLGHQSLACALAGLLESKDPLPQAQSVEVTRRLRFLLENKQHSIWMLIKQWHRKLNINISEWPLHDTALVLAFGFPQWIAKHRSEGRFSLANGSGAVLRIDDDLLRQLGNHSTADKKQGWLVVANMQLTDKQSDSAMIRYAEPIEFADLKKHFDYFIETKETVQWDDEKQRITASEAQFFAQVSFSKKHLPKPSAASLAEVWKQVILKKGIKALPFDERTTQLIKRVALVNEATNTNSQSSALPDFSDKALLNSIDEWLLPFLVEQTSWQALTKLPYYQLLSQQMDYQQLKVLNTLLPESIVIPTGRKASIAYNDEGKAILSVRMQELYGLQEHPTILNGTLPITCELLSPAQRPLQTTDDLIGFWKGSYKQVQKEMKGRYPRHFWPDDPANSPATASTKKRMQS